MELLPISLLLVDDEKTIRFIYEKLFSQWVESFFVAANGQEGYDMFVEHQPDLVITDIRMPVMNGLDMTLMIKRQYPQARIIILSAFNEANYLIRAIEAGVKGFLIKPVDNNILYNAVYEQAKEIQIGQKLVKEELKRIKAEVDLRHNEQILQAVNEVAAHLINFGFNSDSIRFTLKTLGQAAHVSRVYLFENYIANSQHYCRQTYEWTAEDIDSQAANENLAAVSHTDVSFKRWAEALSRRQTIHGLIRDFPEVEKLVLSPQNILSIMVIPVFVQQKWFGFIGFDDCVEERSWTTSEINTLMTAANLFGSAIFRASIVKQLQELNADLEDRVKQRTQKLEEEVNERINAESLLRQSEEKYRSIFENANDAIFLCIKKKIKLVNPRFYELTGYYPNQVQGKSFLEIVQPEFHRPFLESYYTSYDPIKVNLPCDIQIITSDGKLKWVEVKTSPILWDGREAFLSFLTDIQKRKTLETNLRELNTNLEARVEAEVKHREKQQQLVLHKSKLESLGELSAGMAHEINQPLGSISMSIDNILDQMNLGAIDAPYLSGKFELIFKDIERIKQIIEHVRIFSRNQQNTQIEVFNINNVLENSLMLLRKLFDNSQINLQIFTAQNNYLVYGNPFQLEQVILNVLSNAYQAIAEKQKKLDNQYNKEISIELFTKNEKHFMIVTDNGIGINEMNLGNVFDPFFTTKDATKGTGLGLSVSYGIIRSMDGSIEIESIENQYTKLTIQLPVYVQ